MTTRTSCSYVHYLDKLVDKYNNICRISIDSKIIHVDYIALPDEIGVTSQS